LEVSERADGYPPLFGGEWELRQNGISGANTQEGAHIRAPFLFCLFSLKHGFVSQFPESFGVACFEIRLSA
jgi:hypothetical protein